MTFTSVGQVTVDKMNSLADECKYIFVKPSFKPRIHSESEQFAFHTVECKQIQDIVSAMPTNKAPGIDKIPVRVVTGTFPSLWKMAEVTHIRKEDDHEKPNNNRPVSLLPCLSQVCENVALNFRIKTTAFYRAKWKQTISFDGNVSPRNNSHI